MKLFCLPCGSLQANCYILADELTGNCIVIDPGDSDPVLDYVEKQHYSIKNILLTHGHFDHCSGVAAIQKKTECTVCIHKADEELVTGDSPYISAMQYGLTPFIPTQYLENNDMIILDSIRLKVLHTPGHSKGCVCFVDEMDSCVFSGDTLFFESIGRTDLHGGSMKDLAASVFNILFSLPDNYTVYPGHAEQTTIGHEKVCNALVRYYDYFKQEI